MERPADLNIVLPHPSKSVTVPERGQLGVDDVVLCFRPLRSCKLCSQTEYRAVIHEVCYEVVDKDIDAVASHLRPIHLISRRRRVELAVTHLRQALANDRISADLGGLRLNDLSLKNPSLHSLPYELQIEILLYAWPCVLLHAAVFQWARAEVSSAAKRIFPMHSNLWNPQEPHVVRYISIMGVQYVAGIFTTEDKLTHSVPCADASGKVVVAFDEYGIVNIKCLKLEEIVRPTKEALWYKILRNDRTLILKSKVYTLL